MRHIMIGLLALLVVSGCDDDGSPDADADGDIDADGDGDGDGDGDADADGDGDGDADGDSDADADGDGDGDADSDSDADGDDADIVHFHPECIDVPNTQVIAIWDVVPLQTFTGSFKVGVVGFHELGLDVEFTVDGGAPRRVGDPTLNDRTNVYEYWIELNASDHADGPITIGATAIPDCEGHLERVLPEITLYANGDGSLTNDTELHVDCATGSDDDGDGSAGSPFATIERGLVEVGEAGTVLLAAGTCYRLTNDLPSTDYARWTTVRPAPGVSRADVQIMTDGPDASSTGRFGENMVRWQEVAMYKDVDPGYSTVFYFESGHSVWFDEAELYDARGQWNGGQPFGGNSPYSVYVTDAYFHDIMNAGMGFNRGVTMENIGSDVFRGSSNLLSVNLTVLGIDRGTTDAHPDFIQFYNPDSTVDNAIIYNALVYDMGAQGIFGGPGQMRNVAFVNLLMEKDPSDSFLISQFSGDWDHVLLWHLTTVDSGVLIREGDMRNFWVQNSIFSAIGSGSATELPGWLIDHNHMASLNWDQEEPMGTNATVGDPVFNDEPSDDYTLGAGSRRSARACRSRECRQTSQVHSTIQNHHLLVCTSDPGRLLPVLHRQRYEVTARRRR